LENLDFSFGMSFGFGLVQTFGFSQTFGSKCNHKPKYEGNIFKQTNLPKVAFLRKCKIFKKILQSLLQEHFN
jgi:hypothetical protein